MIRKLLPLFPLAFLIGCGSPESAKVSPDKPATVQPASEKEAEAPSKRTSVSETPAEFNHKAHRYFGLDQSEPSNLTIVTSLGGAKQNTLNGTQTTTYTGMEAGQARYLVERTGDLAVIGNDMLAVDGKGVWIVGTSTGKLERPSLEMPANVAPGSTWKASHKIELTGGRSLSDDMSYRATGIEKVKTKLGEFDALVIESNGSATEDGVKYRIESRHWYVEGRGAVKIEIKRSGGGQAASTMSIEEVP